MSMAPASPAFASDLLSLVKQGLISQERVDASCRRVLEFKNALGLLNKDGPPEAPKDIEVRPAQMRKDV
jgi:beta-glucosidase-like glycosyl hydrolase